MALQVARSFSFLVGALVLSACTENAGTGAVSSAVPLSAIPRTVAIVLDDRSGGSWMLPEAKNEDLIYTSDINLNRVFVLSLPAGKLVGTLAFSDEPWALCSDDRGDVFITHFHLYGGPGAVDEYEHGGSSPIAKRTLPNSESGACSYDATTGDLAVTSTGGGPTNGPNIISVFSPPLAKRLPPRTINAPFTLGAILYCGYDDAGNLFLTPIPYPSGATLVELPKGSNTLVNINFVGNAPGGGAIQWHGSYLATSVSTLGSEAIEHVKVSGTSGRVLGVTHLPGTQKDFADNQFWIQDDEIVAPFEYRRGRSNKAGLWTYPGGSRIKIFRGFDPGNGLVGVTMSRATK
jgi:hypothetical protein